MALAQIQTLFQCLVNCTSGSQPPLSPVLDSPGLQYCTTPGCIQSAHNFLQSIDLDKKPCDNFYQHVCGRWEAETRLPDDKSVLSRFGIMDDLVTKRVEALLSKPSDNIQSKSIRAAKDLHQSCVDLESRELAGLKPLHTTLAELGGWPLLGNAKIPPSDVDWSELVGKLSRDYGSQPLVQSTVAMDDFHPEKYILWIHEGSLGLPGRDYYLQDGESLEKIRKGYLDYMVQIGELLLKDLGQSVDKGLLTKKFEDILALETKIAKATRTPVEQRDPWSMMNYYTLKNSTNSFNWFNWHKYLKLLMPTEGQSILSDNFLHIDAAPKYFTEMATIVQEADKETLINYIYWRFVQDWAYSLDSKMRKLSDDFRSVQTGQIAPKPMWKHCVSSIHHGSMNKAVGAIYARKYFQDDFKPKSTNMVKAIMYQFNEKILKAATFMDPETKAKALEKSKNMEPMVSYPDYVMDDAELDKQYPGLQLPTNVSYFEKLSGLAKWRAAYDMLKLLRPYKREFESSAAIVNAFYNPSINSIVIPGGILAAPFYSNDNFKAVNYGGIASVVGHEVSHGFDDYGSQYDINGKLTKWWSKKSEKNFNDLKKCFVDQYGAYFVNQANQTINGNLTIGENIADNGGVRTAYLAYKNTLRKSEAYSLPGLEKYTNDQLFFLSYANIWCRKATDQYMTQQILTDPHSPAEARVNIPLTNFDVFARTFNCPVGSKMNPTKETKRCRLW